jgi:hypothetical protein
MAFRTPSGPGVVTSQCYPLVVVPPVTVAKYSDDMITAASSPGPRDGLDEGSLTELAQDGREIEIELEVERPRPWASSAVGPISVPEDASALIDGLAAYGA